MVQHPATKPVLFAVALVPFTVLTLGVVQHSLGPNPAETLIRSLGDWTLRFLCLTLAVTPLRQWTGVATLARLRRMLGLFTAFYATLHFTAYAVFDMGLVWSDIVRDVYFALAEEGRLNAYVHDGFWCCRSETSIMNPCITPGRPCSWRIRFPTPSCSRSRATAPWPAASPPFAPPSLRSMQ